MKKLVLAAAMALAVAVAPASAAESELIKGATSVMVYIKHCSDNPQPTALVELTAEAVIKKNAVTFLVEYASFTGKVEAALSDGTTDREVFWVAWCGIMQPHIEKMNAASNPTVAKKMRK